MTTSPFSLMFFTVLGLVLEYQKLVIYLNLRTDAATWLLSVLAASFYGCVAYSFSNLPTVATAIYKGGEGNPGFYDQWWWDWSRASFAVVVGVGAVLHLVYRLAGSWDAAKQNVSAARERAEKAKKSDEENTEGPAWFLYFLIFIWSEAMLDCAFWIIDMSNREQTMEDAVRPLCHSLGPFVIVALIALLRSKRVRGKTRVQPTRLRTIEGEGVEAKDNKSMV